MNNYINSDNLSNNFNINDHNIYNLIITVVISENEEYVYMVTMNYNNINVARE